MIKSELRRIFLAKRRELSTVQHSAMSRQIANRFFSEFGVREGETVHSFISIPRVNEIDTSLIYERVWDEFPGVRVVAPRMNSETGQLESVSFTPDTELIENHWGIREPGGTRLTDPVEIDTVLVPLLCFDLHGQRVGYGKGFYDRFLAKCRPDCRKIGLSLFVPVQRIDDAGAHDVPLDHCITPERTYSFV